MGSWTGGSDEEYVGVAHRTRAAGQRTQPPGRVVVPPGSVHRFLRAGDLSPSSSTSRRAKRLLLGLGGLLLALTAAVARGWWPCGLDQAVAQHLPGPHPSGVSALLLPTTWLVATLATPQVVVAVTLAIAAWWSWRDRSRRVFTAALSRVVLLSIAVLAGKALLNRPGPPGSPPHNPFGYYPSGHTTTAVVCIGTLALLVARVQPQWRGRLLAATALWSTIVGASLVYHRYHWLTDVIAGALLGTLVLLAADAVSPMPEVPDGCRPRGKGRSGSPPARRTT